MNKELMNELKGRVSAPPSKKARASAESAQAVLEDARFAKLFSHADFERDKT